MHTFTVWAPKSSAVTVKTGDGMYPMSRWLRDSRPGWWKVEVERATDGTDYAFLLNNDPHAYPDPRSCWQPNGVHAPSRIVDHSLFKWSDQTWQATPLLDAIIYELHLGTFTPEGTCDAAITRLAYLRELGITHIELMPVAAFTGKRGWGYDGVALFAPNDAYGGPDALKRVVDACHTHGLAVLLDVVYNHFGPVGNYTGKFGPYIIESHSTPWGGAVNLDEAGSMEVRRFYCDNALSWLRDYHFDGLRLDAVQTFVDRSATHFLEQLSQEVECLSAQAVKPFVLIAESDLNDPRIITPCSVDGCGAGGYGMDAQWSDDFHHALFAVLTGERNGYYADFGLLSQLAKALSSAFVYDGGYSQYREHNHGRPIGNLPGHRFLGYIQNHDQVGNRAQGDRLHPMVSLGSAKVAAALVMTAPFVPMIFQGEEFAASTPFQYFCDYEDPAVAKSVSDGRHRECIALGWDPKDVPDPQDPATFERSKLKWNESTTGHHAEMLNWYQKLIRLRRGNPSLTDGDLHNTQVQFDEQAKWLRMRRGGCEVVCNLSHEEIIFHVASSAHILLTSSDQIMLIGTELTLPAESVAILSL